MVWSVSIHMACFFSWRFTIAAGVLKICSYRVVVLTQVISLYSSFQPVFLTVKFWSEVAAGFLLQIALSFVAFMVLNSFFILCPNEDHIDDVFFYNISGPLHGRRRHPNQERHFWMTKPIRWALNFIVEVPILASWAGRWETTFQPRRGAVGGGGEAPLLPPGSAYGWHCLV